MKPNSLFYLNVKQFEHVSKYLVLILTNLHVAMTRRPLQQYEKFMLIHPTE